MRILFYQSYGSDRRYHLELTYSVLSAYEFLKSNPSDIRILLVTDQGNVRADLPVEHIVLDSSLMNEWQMQGTYNHAMHAYSINHVLQKFMTPTVLVDSDTIFRAHPEKLFERIGPGRSLFHMSEGRIDRTPEWPLWEKLILRSSGEIDGLPLSGSTVMYNAGIIGLHPANVVATEKIKQAMFSIRQKSDVFTAVQLAASMVLSSETQVSSCEDIVEHYWGGPREYYRYQINNMFPEILRGSGVEVTGEPLPKLNPELRGALKYRFLARIHCFLRNSTKEYQHAYMAYLSSLGVSKSDPDLANVWSAEAVNMLTYGTKMRAAYVYRDFMHSNPERLTQLSWMRSDIKKRWKKYWTECVEQVSKS